jgi:hypothetical protein
MAKKTHQGDLKKELPLLLIFPYVATVAIIAIAVGCMVAQPQPHQLEESIAPTLLFPLGD